MGEYYCPKCGAVLNEQNGFDPAQGTWKCTECGAFLMDDEVYSGHDFEGVAWFCDSCGALLNCQDGFSDVYGSWSCTNCGYNNPINEDNIFEEAEFSCPNCGVALDYQPGFDKYDDNWECTACGTSLYHKYSCDEYSIVEEPEYKCPNCDAALDYQPGFNKYDDDWECTACGASLHHKYSCDEYSIAEEPEYKCPNCDAALDYQSGFDKYDDNWECTACGTQLHRKSNRNDYCVAEESQYLCPVCGSDLTEQMDFDCELLKWECIECGAKLHRDYYVDSFEEAFEDAVFTKYKKNNSDVSPSNIVNCSQSNKIKDKKEQHYSEVEKVDRGDRDASLSVRKKIPRWRIVFSVVIISILTLIIVVSYYESTLLIVTNVEAEDVVGKEYQQVVEQLKKTGFTWIITKEKNDLSQYEVDEVNAVCEVQIAFESEFHADSEFPSNFPIIVYYHAMEKRNPPLSSNQAKGENYKEVLKVFNEAGFYNISYDVKYDILTGWLAKDGDVKKVTIDGREDFSTEKEYKLDAEIVISYHTYRKNKGKRIE
ncbi:MAG: hypothetical protein Q4B73_08350 [Lachnospiraceae bacterium]|nr:hypothetical protein [Lachnospiraceae bacterium]